MATFTNHWPENIPGKFYVDYTCLDCDLCRETAPDIFKRNDEGGYAFVHRQPETDEEIEKALEALEGCPCESIGADGDKNDWSQPTDVVVTPPTGEKRTCGCKHGQCEPDTGRLGEAPLPEKPAAEKAPRPWWKFWA